MSTTAEVFAIGDELCYGRVYDTNSFWLADQLTRRGVHVQRITCLRDKKEEICEALRNSINRRPTFILITGGLGPTQDDLTLTALSDLSRKPIITSQHILDVMAERRRLPKSSFNPGQLKMAETIQGAECVPNPTGFAPVTILTMGASSLISMPGPPREVQACFNEILAERIEKVTGFRSVGKRVRVTMFESELAPLVLEAAKAVDGVYIKPLVSDSSRDRGLAVEVLAFDHSEEACRQKCDQAVAKLKDLVTKKGQELIDAST